MLRARGLMVAALTLAGVAISLQAQPALAREENTRRLVVAGMITVVEPVSGSDRVVIVIDKGDADDNPEDNYALLVNADTKIVPEDREPEVGMVAKAVFAPRVEGTDGPRVALRLILPRRAPDGGSEPPRDRPAMRVHACGVIASLPDAFHSGPWTLTVEGVGPVTFHVTGDTHIKPADLLPAVGMTACINAHVTADGNVADVVELRRPRGDRPADRKVELRGVVVELPEDRSGEWTLLLQVRGREEPVHITVNADTEIRGDLANGKTVVVLARQEARSDGLALTAEKIIVQAGNQGDPTHPGPARRVEGTVLEIAEDGHVWVIENAEGHVRITIAEHTNIIGLGDDESPVGKSVRAEVKVGDGGALVALVIKINHD
jgi:hypothetical protein